MNTNLEKVVDVLSECDGPAYALTVKDIAALTAIPLKHDTGSSIRTLITEATFKALIPIGSNNNGYFRITSRGELDNYVESLQKRIDALQERVKAVTKAYHKERNSRHRDTSFSLKERCRFYAIYLAEEAGIPYQAIWSMAYRKLSKGIGVDLANLPSWYRGSTLNYISSHSWLSELYQTFGELEKAVL